MRLVGGSGPGEGRVEVSHDGEWGSVCDDFWGHVNAAVVCGSLGYSTGIAISAPENQMFGEGSGPIWLDDVYCVGNELDLTNCPHSGWGVHDCRHSEDVGVICSKFNPSLVSQAQLVDRILYYNTLAVKYPKLGVC